MLICPHTVVLLLLFLHNTVTHGCSHYYTDLPIHVDSSDSLSDSQGDQKVTECRYFIKAPKDHSVMLNFTQIRGCCCSSYHSCPFPCSSRIEWWEIIQETGKEKFFGEKCLDQEGQKSTLLITIASEELVIIYYKERHKDTHFTLDVDFKKLAMNNSCLHRCDNGDCLLSKALFCNDARDCSDGSDEENCATVKPIEKEKVLVVSGQSITQLVIIMLVGAAVLILTISCCVCYFVSGRNQLGIFRRRAGTTSVTLPRSENSEQNQLMNLPSTSDIICEAPSTSSGGKEPWQRELHLKHKREEEALKTQQSRVPYPPMCPRSKDGEEGYHPKHTDSPFDSGSYFRPPPNRTVPTESLPLERASAKTSQQSRRALGGPSQGAAPTWPLPNRECSDGQQTPTLPHTPTNPVNNPVNGHFPGVSACDMNYASR